MSDLNRSPLLGTRFWRDLDARIQRQLRRRAAPVRVVLSRVNGAYKGLLASFEARAGETVDEVEMAQHFGFRSVAPSGLEAVAVPIGGSSGHMVIVGEIDRSTDPPTLASGEACLYSTGNASVAVRADGSVEISGAASVSIDGTSVVLNGPGLGVARIGDTVTVTGTAPVGGGAITASGVIATGSATVQAGG